MILSSTCFLSFVALCRRNAACTATINDRQTPLIWCHCRLLCRHNAACTATINDRQTPLILCHCRALSDIYVSNAHCDKQPSGCTLNHLRCTKKLCAWRYTTLVEPVQRLRRLGWLAGLGGGRGSFGANGTRLATDGALVVLAENVEMGWLVC